MKQLGTNDEKLMQELSTFHEALDHSINAAWTAGDHLPALATGANALAEKMQAVGEAASQKLAEALPKGLTHLDAYLLHFEWAEEAKSFLVLWRDVLFQYQKAALLQQEGKVDSEAVGELKARSLEAMQAAAAELKGFVEKRLAEIRIAKNGEKKQVGKWKLQTDPWPKYSGQLAKLAVQCSELAERQGKLIGVAASLSDLGGLIGDTLFFCQKEIDSFKATGQQTIEFVEANGPEPGKVASHLEALEADLKMTSYASSFTHALDDKIAELPEKEQVPVGTDGGLVLQREIAFRRRTQQWLESEVLPLLYEVWELTERVGNSMKMSLVNIRNRAILLSKTDTETVAETQDLGQPLVTFLKTTELKEAELAKLKALISSRMSGQFELSAVLQQQREFLPVPLQSTIEQMKLDQHPLLVRGQAWLQKMALRLRQVRSDVVQEGALSQSEKIVRYLQERTGDADNDQYSNIFLTKGYIGESFIVGREDELAHVRNIVGNYRLGFRGAVILSGRRFAGKSLFGELVANRHFIGHTIRLSPNAGLEVKGRRMTTTYNMGEALDFIQKHTLGERMLVWIDDLELWADSNTPLSQNVRHLCRSIDSHSDRLFYLVSMNTWLRAHLDRFHDVSLVFQAEVNLDRMSAAEIRQAILIRHGATHKKLVDKEGKEVSPKQFQQMTNRVYKATEGNIGEALNRWSAATSRVDEEQVMHDLGPGNPLPDFLTPDNTILLRTLLLEKRTNEYRLRKIFGPAFKEKYGGILQRLLRVGLLVRELDGWLEVNEVAVNEVGGMVFGDVEGKV